MEVLARMRRAGESSNPNEFDQLAFNRTRYWVQKTFALDVAQATPLELLFKGNFLYADTNTTGSVSISLNTDNGPFFPFRTNTGVQGPEYERLYLTWAAQAGKVLNLWYGFDARIIPPNQDISNIGTIGTLTTLTSITNALTPPTLGTSGYRRKSASSALGTIVTPASNVNGVVVTGGCTFAGNSDDWRLMYKTSAPSAWNDATAIGIFDARDGASSLNPRPLMGCPYIIPAGYGLYEQASAAAATSGCDISYRVL